MDLTLAAVLTAGGAVLAAGLITGLIEMFKRLPAIGPLIDGGREPLVAFVLSAALVVLAFLEAADRSPTAAFAAFLAWYGIARIAMGIHDDVAGGVARVAPTSAGETN